MLVWMLSVLGVVVAFAVIVIRKAEVDDKQRKMGNKRAVPNTWK